MKVVSSIIPEKIKIINNQYLSIKWEDSSETMVLISNLRKHCPCANCYTERQNKPKTYIPLFSSPQLKIKEIRPIGNYAIQIVWEDGHDTGIYSYDKLYENRY